MLFIITGVLISISSKERGDEGNLLKTDDDKLQVVITKLALLIELAWVGFWFWGLSIMWV